jgi:lipopolysaccharide/colanic/teichoic acid biosynthesis glycosyltransferase
MGMNLFPLIIDAAAAYAGRSAPGLSLLSLPLGAGTILDEALERLGELRPAKVLVLLAPGVSAGGPVVLENRPQTRFFARDALGQVLDELDGIDAFLVIDARVWPAQWPSLAEVSDAVRDYRGATHAVAIGAECRRVRERVECDGDGHLRRVRRLYPGMHWPEAAGELVAWSVVPARSLPLVRFGSLGELRRELALRGVLSRDKPVGSGVLDLTRPEGYLALSERSFLERLSRARRRPGYRSPESGVIVEESSRVAESARLVPPVIIREQAGIGDRAVVVGPAMIGPGVSVGSGAVIAQAIILPGAAIADGQEVRQQVYAGPATATPSSGGWVPAAASEPHEGWKLFAEPGALQARRLGLAAKRIMDLSVASLLLAVLSPLLVAIAILVKLDSPGPVFFAHVRERRGGREFRCIKFRTMVPDADHRQRDLRELNLVDGPQFKLARDPRVTRIGRRLRATNLDELPQLFNVLLGHMSLVGPRPSPFRENQICIPWRQARLSVKPGITGLWQLCRAADRSGGDFHEWIFYDLAYVRHRSLWLDLKILVATALTLGGRRRVSLDRLLPERARRGQEGQPA